MPIRNNVRERRRERIQQLLEQHAAANTKRAELIGDNDRGTDKSPLTPSRTTNDDLIVVPPKTLTQQPLPQQLRSAQHPSQTTQTRMQLPIAPSIPRGVANVKIPEPGSPADVSDPELWWKEREKQLKSGTPAGWQGLKGLSPTSNPSNREGSYSSNSNWSKLIQGLTLRTVFALIFFAGAWGWMKLELPGSAEAHEWLVSSVTRDMDFQAIEAWYGSTFGGSPTFFPFKGEEPDTRAVTALLNPTDTSLPVKGKLVQSYAQNGTGVRVAASGGSDVVAIYTGRVQQVSTDQDGGMTIIVQHQNHYVTVYGNLAKSDVKANDWVEKGQTLGKLHSSEGAQEEGVLYFAVQQNGKALDPADVVSFD
ncbi:M23 family metallopeptidase [Cohnella endophytica]|uniref:M23 family metallopeptidase n=1 Tax=Cohnella endophytica TaxID=2419778 RepID=A0A494XUL3_9BACL|nr:M23 family metallopeptidase [Cohnella endophytica]RKP54248.1 M23 family metallopeptidase [Cohnella endophytica]